MNDEESKAPLSDGVLPLYLTITGLETEADRINVQDKIRWTLELLEDDSAPVPGLRWAFARNPDVVYVPKEYIEAMQVSGPGAYIVTRFPSSNVNLEPEWAGWAENPVDAMSRYAVAAGFVEYWTPEISDSVGVWANENSDPVGAHGVFTNYEIFACQIGDLHTPGTG